MKKVFKNGKKGFTIAELLIVVAIIIILAAFAFIAGARLIRNMRQSHLDKRAEAVYYAAQSRMMELFVTEEKTEKKEGEKVKSVVEKLYNAKTFEYNGGTLAYITSEDAGEAKELFANDKSLDVEIKGASWIIEYDPVSLDVYAVILSDDLERAGTSVAGLSQNPPGAPVRGTPQDRIAAFNAYVGYYSEGANSGLGANAKGGLSAGAWILNRRDLIGVIKITVDENTRKAIDNLAFKVTLSGIKSTKDNKGIDISSNKIYWQNYSGNESNNFLNGDGTSGIEIITDDVRNTIPTSCFGTVTDNSKRYGLIGYIKLDSLDIDGQFKNLKASEGGTLGNSITPGDDIKMSVKVWDSGDGNSKYSQNVRSSSATSNTENSLYADFDAKDGYGVATIVYPRHLQNLAKDYSEVEAGMAAGDQNPASMEAVLLEDIIWDEAENLSKSQAAQGAVRNFTPISNNQLVSFNGYRFDSAANAQPLKNIEDAANENPEEVNCKSTLNENKYHIISGLRVDTSDGSYPLVNNPADAGLFGKQSNLMLANLVISNFDIKNTNSGGTGMLAGDLTGCKVKNVFICDKHNTTQAGSATGSENLVITGSGDTAGAVGVMSSTSIENCVIKNISVKATSGAAGALAGKATSATIKNALAYNGEMNAGEGQGSGSVGTTVGFDDSKIEITGARNAGGLIGEMSGGSVTGSAAALYVRATGGNAGGFVGQAQGASMDMCQAGGHTITIDGHIGRYDKAVSGTDKGRVNVVGSSNAGGFAGRADSSTIQNSYSTCSASGATVGGFAGSASGGNIATSYAVGQVFFTSKTSAGGFAGSLGGTGLAGNHYFEIINPTTDGEYLKGIAGTTKDEDGIKAIDAPLEKNETEFEYDKFMLPASDLTLERQDKTHRYDSELQPAIFGMPFCSQLKNTTDENMLFSAAHYGDWPVVETLIVNADASAKVRINYRDPFATIKAFAGDLSKSDIVRNLAEAVITEPISGEDNGSDGTSVETEKPSDEETEDNSGKENSEDSSNEGSSSESDEVNSAVDTDNQSSDNSSEENSQQDEEAQKENTEQSSDTASNEATSDNKAEEGNSEDKGHQDNAGDKDSAEGSVVEEPEKNPADDEALPKEDSDIMSGGFVLIENEAEEEEVEEESFGGCLVAEDKGVTITYGEDAGIPEGAVLEVTDITDESEDYDYPQIISDANEAVELSTDQVASYRALDIAIKYDGEQIQPKAPVEVEIRTENLYENKELFIDDELAAVHIKEEEPEVIGTELKKDEELEKNQEGEEDLSSNEAADSVNFTSDGFSVYVLVQPIREKRVVTTDDGTYTIAVDYDNASGIPADAQLVVSEIEAGSDEYAEYVEQSASELGTYSEFVKLARVFDISFVNPENGETYQPDKDVKVSVELAEEINTEEESVNVVHFGENTEVLDASFNDGITEFSTSGFSSYTILTLPTFDVFDTSLDGENYYIDYEDGASVKHYLFIDNSSSPSVLGYTEDITKATSWKFELFEEGYKIGAGGYYVDAEAGKWVLKTDPAVRFTASDWGDHHLLCIAKNNNANKYLGYSASGDHLDVMVNSQAAHLHLTKAPGESDIEDKSYNGRKLYVLDGGYFLAYTPGSAETKITVPSRATEWTFGLGDHGYRLHNGETYVGIMDGKVVFTQAAMAAEFRVTDVGDYHLLEYYDKAASVPGYNGQFLYINNTSRINQFGIISADPANPIEGVKLQLVGDVSINGDYVLYLKDRGINRFAVSDISYHDASRGDLLEPVNINEYVREDIGIINDNTVIKTIWSFEKTDTTFGHYIKVSESAATPSNVGKYLNFVWENGKGNVRLSDNPQLLYIYLMRDSRIRIVSDDSGSVPMALDYSNGGKKFQAYSKFDADSDLTNVVEWFRIAQVSDRKNYTVNYSYPKEKDDVGTRNNLPLADTEVVSGATTTLNQYVLKAPSSNEYISYDNEWKYTYEFVGWKIYGYQGTHEEGSYYTGEIIDLTHYMDQGTSKERASDSVADIKAFWKLKKKEPLSYTVNYHMTDAEPSYGIRIEGGKLPDVIDLDYASSTSLIATEQVGGAAGADYVVRNIGYKDSDGTYYSSYQEKMDPGGYFPNDAVRTYQRVDSDNDERTYHTYLFRGWEAENGEVLNAYDLDHVKHDLGKYDENMDGVIDLKAVWSFNWSNTSNSNPTANLSVLINADQVDNPERAEEFLTEDRRQYIHIDGAIMYRLDENGNPIMLEECPPVSKKPYKYFMQYIIDENGVTRTEKDIVRADKSIRKELAGKDGFYDDGTMDRKVHTKYEDKTGAPRDDVEKNHTWQLSYLPSDEYVFDYLKNKSTKSIYIYNEATRKSEKINKSLLNADDYMIRWVVAKYQSGDTGNGFHINAKITKKISCLTVTKTIKGESAALDALINGIEEVSDGDSEAERNRKVEAAKKRFNITLKNKDDENDVLTLTLLNRVTNDVAISKTANAKVAPNTFGYVKYSEEKDNEGKVTSRKYTWLVTFDGEKTFNVEENNYDVKIGNRYYGSELTYNQTNTGNSEDANEKAWDPEKTVQTHAEPSDNTDYDDNESTNFTNNYKEALLFRIKKINDKKEPIKDVEFRVFLKDKTDPLRLYQKRDEADGEYSILYENKKSNVFGLTNDDGYFNVWLAKPDKEKVTYVIQETVIPEGYQGHGKYQPSFEVEILPDGTVSINKAKIKMPSSYGTVEPYVVEEKENSAELVWTKKEYAEQGEEKIAICNGAIVTNSNGIDVNLKKISGICEDDGKAKRLAGAQFMFYDTDPDGDDNSLESVIDGTAKAYESILIKNGNDEIPATVVTSTDSTDKEGNLIFKIPGGIYFMKESAVPDNKKYEPDYYVGSDEDPDIEENHHPYIYKLYVGEENVKQAVEDITADTGKTLEIVETGEDATKFVIVRMSNGKIDKESIQNSKAVIGEYGIINLSKDKAKVLLKKVDGSGKPLAGPKFDIYRSDGMRIPKTEDDPSWSAGNAGAIYIGKLGEGTYYLHESAGGGVGSSKWFRIKVEKDAEGILKASDPEVISKSPFSEITD